MKAVIIYDDFASAAKAKAIFQRAVLRAHGSLSWTIKPWRLDMLNLPLASDVALADAVDAHLILFGLPHIDEFPVPLQNWLERWVAARQVQEPALAVWEDNDTLWTAQATFVSHFAKRYGLSFINGNAASAYAKSSQFAENLNGRNKTTSKMNMPRMLGHLRPGINE